MIQNVANVLRRRMQSIVSRPDVKEILITLLPRLETIDGVKITSEMRNKAIVYCYQHYMFPH